MTQSHSSRPRPHAPTLAGPGAHLTLCGGSRCPAASSATAPVKTVSSVGCRHHSGGNMEGQVGDRRQQPQWAPGSLPVATAKAAASALSRRVLCAPELGMLCPGPRSTPGSAVGMAGRSRRCLTHTRPPNTVHGIRSCCPAAKPAHAGLWLGHCVKCKARGLFLLQQPWGGSQHDQHPGLQKRPSGCTPALMAMARSPGA